MKVFKILVAGILVVLLMSLLAGSAFAAQGVITQVNPSGLSVARGNTGGADTPGLKVANGVIGNLLKVGAGVTHPKDGPTHSPGAGIP